MNDKVKMLPAEEAALKARGYQIGAFLGRGIGGAVYRGTCKGKPIAVKKVNMYSHRCKKIAMEVLLLKLVSHPNVVQYLDLAYLLSKPSLLIFMEYMGGGHLENYIYKADTSLTEASAGKLFRQIVDALSYMHTHGFAHRDLKSENILLDESHKVAKIGDFGTGFVVTDTPDGREVMSHHVSGALEYQPPEALEIKIYDYDGKEKDARRLATVEPGYREAASGCLATYDPSHHKLSPFQADIWSMGVILYEMLHRKLPFPYKISSATADAWFSTPIDPLEKSRMLFDLQQKEVPFKETLSPMAKGLIKKMLVLEPKDRPQMAEILKDEWLTLAVKQDPEVNLLGYLKSACSIS